MKEGVLLGLPLCEVEAVVEEGGGGSCAPFLGVVAGNGGSAALFVR